MKTTIKISRGNQYDGDAGFSISAPGTRAYGKAKLDGSGFFWGGSYFPGSEVREQIEQVITQVLTDGVQREFSYGTDPAPRSEKSGAAQREIGKILSNMDHEDSDY